MGNDIEREAFEAEMARIFDLDDEVRKKLPSQRTQDDEGTEVYEGWEEDEAARSFSVAWQIWQAARAQRDTRPTSSGGVPEVLALCQRCHKEFPVPLESGGNATTDLLCNFCECPHCSARNDLWIKLTNPQNGTPAATQPAAKGAGVPDYWLIHQNTGLITVTADKDEADYAKSLGQPVRPVSILTTQPTGGEWVTQALRDVAAERQRQDGKWGGPEHDDQKCPNDFVQHVEDYAGWARVMAGMGSYDKYRNRMIQVAALACAAVEAVDRAVDRPQPPQDREGGV